MDALNIIPLRKKIAGSIKIPGSKSYTNRALLIAALAKGTSTLKGALFSDDTHYMIQALKKMGIKIKIAGNSITVYGQAGKLKSANLFLGNAGTATRFLTAASAFCAAMPVRIDGDARMCERPIDDLVFGLKQLGAQITFENNNNCPPLIIEKNALGGICEIPGDKSSQFFSALLLASPYTEKNVQVKIIGTLVSRPYLDMTLDIMKTFGVKAENHHYRLLRIKKGQKYLPRNYEIEADCSSMTYFAAIAALNGGSIILSNVNPGSKQADIGFLKVLKKIGVKVQKWQRGVKISGNSRLKALGKINLNHMPDGAMTVAVLCAFAKGKTVLTGLHNLKIKETDRLKALATELKKIGCDCQEKADGLKIIGNPEKLHGARISTYDDHRMAMCFAIAGTKIPGIIIENPECVNKTYPDFWNDLKKIGVFFKKVSTKKTKESLKNNLKNKNSKINIILTGMRGSGKSTIGKLLAKKLHRKFIDLDEEIEKVEKISIADIVKDRGWPHFRKIEQKICTKFSKIENVVISTGGGTCMDKKNVQNLKANGVIFFLKADVKTLAKRIEKDFNRPSLLGKKSFLDELEEVWKKRKMTYQEIADYEIKSTTMKDTTARILEIFKKNLK